MDCPGRENGEFTKVDLFVFSIKIAQISFESFNAPSPFKLRGFFKIDIIPTLNKFSDALASLVLMIVCDSLTHRNWRLSGHLGGSG